MESIAAGVLPIIVNLTSMPRFFPDVQDIDSAKYNLEKLINSSDLLESYISALEAFKAKFFATDKDALSTTILEILSTY
ncbi:hypothetical protein Syn7502_02392 [Synechococcus sp. PCC 7502]|uniref:hypothetical protein n=1 Tax=Synechococcus sp. PCC 7502 TaxID=1173263 RepID=UPI00029FC1EE|nr:hypothetical protein [Synechococcus sp. PCC 7502]AFY74377.1 hypothetical protein Syn7502_02392 [Synechococcus sp. PCC 7502]